MVALGGNGLGVVVATALTSIVIIGRTVNFPEWDALHLLAIDRCWMQAELALLGVAMCCTCGIVDESAREPGEEAVSLFGVDVVLADRRKEVAGGG